jgi:hypothetical protein
MKAKLQVGTEIDFLTSKELREELDAVMAETTRKLRQEPLPNTPSSSVVLDATGFGVIDLGAPTASKVWDVRRVTVTGQNPASAFAGTAVVYRGNRPGDPLAFVDRSTSLPDVSTWSSQQFTLRPEEHLLVQITGGTAGATAFASAQVIEAEVYEAVDTVGIER